MSVVLFPDLFYSLEGSHLPNYTRQDCCYHHSSQLKLIQSLSTEPIASQSGCYILTIIIVALHAQASSDDRLT